MNPVIEARSLSKVYFVRGEQSRVRPLLSEILTERLRHPFRRSSRKQLEEFWALRDLDLDVSAGEKVAIIGPNGAGKSTLLKILSRLTKPSRGQARIKGRLASLLEVNTGFHPELTGRENIFLKATIHGMSRRDVLKKFDEIVEFSGVQKFLDMPVKFYSSGMYVRLGFSVVAHLDPDILVADEVLAVGDASFQQKCLGKMSESAREGRTVIFVSHNMPAVRSLCQRAIVMDKGQKVFDGSSHEAIDHYLRTLGTTRSERVWDQGNPGPSNELFQLQGLRVRNREGAVLDRLANDKPFMIEVDYSTLQDSIAMGVTVIVTNYDGEIVFSSMSNHEPQWHAKPRPVGTYKSVCTVPGDLLREGSYRTSIILWGPGYSSAITAPDLIAFEIFDTGSLRGDYFGGWGGSIKPRLNWSCERVAEL